MEWWQYLLLVNLYLILFYGFYMVLLRSETFFHLNRAYLVISALLSFFIPLIHAEWISKLFITQRVHQTISVYAQPINIYRTTPIEPHNITIGAVIFFVYAAGIVFLTVKLIGQLISLKRLIERPESTSAFSFFKSIRLGNNLENKDIIERHEKAHSSQWHSADVMLIEAISIINWFNPVIYFYKRGIRYIHEYIADRQALQNGTSKAEYAMLLLSQAFKTSAHDLATPFHTESLLKRRIMMLQKARSQYVALVKYGFSAPLFMLMLILSSAAVIKNHTIKMFSFGSDDAISSPIVRSGVAVAPQKAALNMPAKNIPGPESRKQIPQPAGKVKGIDSGPVFTSVELSPAFKGGMLGFYQFLAANLRYPPAMIKRGVQGRVLMSMTVEKDGSLSHIKAIDDIGYGSADEAIRVLKLSPPWKPGYQNGTPVRARFVLPIVFNIVNEKTQSDSSTKVTFPVRLDGQYQYISVNRMQEAVDTIQQKLDRSFWDKFHFKTDPLVLLDGRVIPDIKSIDQAYLKSATVVKNVTKDNVYYVLYGDRALNGVIVLESKTSSLNPRAGK